MTSSRLFRCALWVNALSLLLVPHLLRASPNSVGAIANWQAVPDAAGQINSTCKALAQEMNKVSADCAQGAIENSRLFEKPSWAPLNAAQYIDLIARINRARYRLAAYADNPPTVTEIQSTIDYIAPRIASGDIGLEIWRGHVFSYYDAELTKSVDGGEQTFVRVTYELRRTSSTVFKNCPASFALARKHLTYFVKNDLSDIDTRLDVGTASIIEVGALLRYHGDFVATDVSGIRPVSLARSVSAPTCAINSIIGK